MPSDIGRAGPSGTDSVSEVCGLFSSQVLPSSSGRQPRAVMIAYIDRGLLDSHDQRFEGRFPVSGTGTFALMAGGDIIIHMA